MAKAKKSPEAKGWQIGAAYIIRTVTHYLTGRLVEITEQELVLEEAAWVADTGRYGTALAKGLAGLQGVEVEPFPAGPVMVGRGAIVDACRWPHALPREQV